MAEDNVLFSLSTCCDVINNRASTSNMDDAADRNAHTAAQLALHCNLHTHTRTHTDAPICMAIYISDFMLCRLSKGLCGDFCMHYTEEREA